MDSSLLLQLEFFITFNPRTISQNSNLTMSNLNRFIEAQQSTYPNAFAEIKLGQKQSHWMWYVFPQIAGLGFTEYNISYAIKDMPEAISFLKHPVLGQRLIEISKELLKIENKTALEIMGKPDTKKLQSCMTLFSVLPNTDSVFKSVLDKFYQGETDEKTIAVLKSQS
jgi:uncharacterized protein (DUF1810 family)